MFKSILLLVLFYVGFINAQSIDSTKSIILIAPDSGFVKVDSLLSNDSLLSVVKPDSIAPIYSSILNGKSLIISNDDFSRNDYKYTGDYLRLFPFSFIKDLGFTGQPNESFLYGVGNNSISFLMDGISINDRYSNSLNLNLLQSEDVDSIEIIPLPRGFLYGAYSNSVSINFITKDFITTQPFTRLRFYQGANRDMMLDGSFNAVIMKKLIASFDIANRILDATYQNTDYAIWQGKFKLKYLLSNDMNIIATYNYNDYKAGYSGGVDVDSIKSYTENLNDVLYNFREAPMLFPNGELKTLTHLPRLRVLATPTSWLKTDASLFYMFNRYEKISYGSDNSENKAFGLNIRNDADWSIFKIQVSADYESNKTSINNLILFPDDSVYYNYLNEINEDIFSISGNVSAYINDSLFIPSIFYKTSTLNRSSSIGEYSGDFPSSGWGFDFLFKLKSNVGFYAGTSVFGGYLRSELGTNYKSDFIIIDLRYFINDYTNTFYTGGIFFNQITFGKVNGLGVNVNFNYWKFILETNSSYYTTRSKKLIGVPEVQTQTGIYFSDKLFNDNLDLKTGFIFYYTGKNNVFTYENDLVEVPSSSKLDFTLAGEIQKSAIVYFTWQNLFNSNYYLTPYYPMPGRSIRFGVAWEMFN